jgi:hypothetical protein
MTGPTAVARAAIRNWGLLATLLPASYAHEHLFPEYVLGYICFFFFFCLKC